MFFRWVLVHWSVIIKGELLTKLRVLRYVTVLSDADVWLWCGWDIAFCLISACSRVWVVRTDHQPLSCSCTSSVDRSAFSVVDVSTVFWWPGSRVGCAFWHFTGSAMLIYIPNVHYILYFISRYDKSLHKHKPPWPQKCFPYAKNRWRYRIMRISLI